MKSLKLLFKYEKFKNSIQNAISKFKNHPSIKMIISKIDPNKRFSFYPQRNKILKQIKNLDIEKGNTAKRYPNKIVKAKLLFLFKFLP